MDTKTDRIAPVFPFRLMGNKALRIKENRIFYKNKNSESEIPAAKIYGFILKKGLIFSSVLIETDLKKIAVKFLINKNLEDFLNRIRALINGAASKELDEKGLSFLYDDLKKILKKDGYVAKSDLGGLKEKHTELAAYCKTLSKAKVVKYLNPDVLETINEISGFNFKSVEDKNEKFIKGESKKYESLFINKKGISLTEEQKRAVITTEDRHLLIAAAGSGKTETLIYKLKYMIEKNVCPAEKILVLAYNKDVREELIKRAEKESLNLGKENIHTFHSFGRFVMGKAEKREIKPVDENFAEHYLKTLLRENERFLNAYQEFIIKYINDYEDGRDPYEEYNDITENKRKNGYASKKIGYYKTLKGETVKSYQETVIANFLFMNGVDYVYEKPVYSKNGGMIAKPDFYYPEINLYHEHYAVDKYGNSVFGKDYTDSMNKKRNTYKKMRIKCIETTSDMFFEDKIIPFLKKELVKRGIGLKPKSISEIVSALNKAKENKIDKTILGFLKRIKEKDLDLSDIKNKAPLEKNAYRRNRDLAFLKLFSGFYGEYEKELNKIGMPDFEDLVIKSADYIEKGAYIPQCEFIAVDEFQDISFSRLKLIKAVLEKNKNAKLFAVGDDYQAINGYAGSEVKYFYDFEKIFKEENYGVKVNFLTKTFRCNKGITEYSSEVVQENPKQIKKTIIPATNGKGEKDAVMLVPYENGEKGMWDELLDDLKDVSGKKIFILDRIFNYRDGKEDFSYNLKRVRRTLESKGNTVFAGTIHGVKGLECDIACLLHAEKGVMPSSRRNDSVMDLTADEEEFPFAEERRLFYVALTRAKEKVFMYAEEGKESPFIL